MAETRDGPTLWVDPDQRGIIPLDGFHLSRSLRKRLKQKDFFVTVDAHFATVMDHCAARSDTWINAEITSLCHILHREGFAHSVEVWRDDTLIGGLYGLRLGGAFFGESMFSTATDGSKIALAYLVARLRAGGFTLLDTQFITDHLASLGGVEIPRARYHELLSDALEVSADWDSLSNDVSSAEVIHLITQTS